jgi:hypothetical protein
MHFGPDDYNHLIGYQFVNSDDTRITIDSIDFQPDNTYCMTDGIAGKIFLVKLDNGKSYHIRNFKELTSIYGEPQPTSSS